MPGLNERYYVNGKLVNSISLKSMPSGTYYLGAWASATQQNYYGYMSDFRFYATALTDAEVLALYNKEI